MYKLKVVTVCQRTTNCEYCQCIGQYRRANVRNVLPCPNYCTRYVVVLTYRHFVLCTTWDVLALATPAPHATPFVGRSHELLNSTYGRSATGAERPILNPSKVFYQFVCRCNSMHYNHSTLLKSSAILTAGVCHLKWNTVSPASPRIRRGTLLYTQWFTGRRWLI